MIPSLIEAALRSGLVAIAVWGGLRLFRVSNVLAQKAAWGLVLASAVLMPLLLPYAARLSILSPHAAIVLPPDPETLLGKIRAQMRPAPIPQPTGQTPQQPVAAAEQQAGVSNLPEPEAADAGDSASKPVSPSSIAARTEVGSVPALLPSVFSRLRALSWNRFGLLLYAAVATFMVLRLALGLFRAVRIWLSARPVGLTDAYAAGLRLRSSSAVSSPVTIGSSVILPADYETWDSQKLRIVLAHERSHICQGDFYLQLLAGLYATLFWFSPLGWWLRHKLSDLAEAISDRAGLQQAASRSSYAQVLLEFAAAPRPTLIGVAMARTGNVSRRIERLLNDATFRQAFAGTRRRALIAVLIVPVALFAATALIRVQAAGQEAPSQPAPPAQPDAPAKPPIAGVSTPDQPSDPPTPAAIQAAPSAPAAPAAPEKVAPVPPLPPIDAVEPVAPAQPRGKRTTIARTVETRSDSSQDRGTSYRYSYSSNGESFGIVRGDGQVHFSGDLHSPDIDKIRKQAHGDFIWFTRDGKSYFIDDPGTLKQVEDLYKPMELLGKQQEELGRQQEVLGKQQEELGRQQEQVAVPTPDVSKEIAEINAASAKLQSMVGKTVTQQELADLQSKLGDLQGRLGDLQGKMGSKQGEFGAKMGLLGAQQGKLGAQQGKLGAEQGRLAQQADQKVKSIIDESLQNGKAHPVN
jgi:beta-lactamase regulating signal transducer with metallopeptidase domain